MKEKAHIWLAMVLRNRRIRPGIVEFGVIAAFSAASCDNGPSDPGPAPFEAAYQMVFCDGRATDDGCGYFSSAASQRKLDSAFVNFGIDGLVHAKFWYTLNFNGCTVSGPRPNCTSTSTEVDAFQGKYTSRFDDIAVDDTFVPGSRQPLIRILTPDGRLPGTSIPATLLIQYHGSTNRYDWVFEISR